MKKSLFLAAFGLLLSATAFSQSQYAGKKKIYTPDDGTTYVMDDYKITETATEVKVEFINLEAVISGSPTALLPPLTPSSVGALIVYRTGGWDRKKIYNGVICQGGRGACLIIALGVDDKRN